MVQGMLKNDFDEGMTYKEVKEMYDYVFRDSIFAEPDHQLLPYKELSEREKLILILHSEGLSQTDISKKLGVTDRTIRNYFRTIRNKFGVPGLDKNLKQIKK